MKKLITLLVLPVAVLIMLYGDAFAQDKDASSWKVYGTTFLDYFYKIDGDTNISFGQGEYSRTPKDFQAFAFRRIYLGLDYKFSDEFSARVLLEGSDGTPILKGDRGVFIKAAHLDWHNLIPLSTIVIGQSPTPTWSLLEEGIWKYRSVEKTITDFRGLGRSNDLGLRISGAFEREKNFGYSLMVGNGRGSKPEDDKLKVFYGMLWGKFLDKRIIASAYGDYGDENSLKSKATMKGFLAYQSPEFTIGIEALQQIQKNFYTPDSTNIVPFGVTLFARGPLIKNKLNAFARFDYYDPDTDYTLTRIYSDENNYYKQNFILVGLDYVPHEKIHIMPNVWINTYSDKRDVKIERKADVVGRITFSYTLN